MRWLSRLSAAVAVIFLAVRASAATAPAPRCEPWESEYVGQDAAGPHVIALWQFASGKETEDSSGHGHVLKFEGVQPNPNGRFGGCLESFRGWPAQDKRHAAIAKNHPALSPQGAFTLELWIQPSPELDAQYPAAFLLDKKYVAHDDYQLILDAPDKQGARVLHAVLGFGDSSSSFYSKPMRFEPGAWYHVAMTYDGAGTVSFFINGNPWGSSRSSGRGSISPGRHFLSIGDRVGSLYHGFPGRIDQVRISRGALEFQRLKWTMLSDRACFVRMEQGVSARLQVQNLQREPVSECVATMSLGGLAARQAKIADLAAGATMELEYPIDTSLRPDLYSLKVQAKTGGRRAIEIEQSFPLRIVPRRPPQFPVVMWGVGNPASVVKETERLRSIGFTHVLGVGADYADIWQAGKPTQAASPQRVAEARQMLDEALANGLSIVASLSPGSAMESKPELLRVNRKGEPQKKAGVCGLLPGMEAYCDNVGASVAASYAEFPAFQAALLHTEVRDAAQPCFHAQDLAAFRRAAGIDVPAEVASKWGVDWRKLKDFPASRVVPDDHPVYRYFQWYWKSGDGWNGLNSAVARGLKSTGRKDLWTWHDPAVRVASVYGSGGEVDVISQWTYSYPDPIRIAVATDELLAMAAGSGRKQDVMKMTQIIWYRSQTAPEPKPGAARPAYQARWETEQPDAPFITIAPMHLREAFWTKIARPIRGIMYHGWQSLVPCDAPGGYRYTHPETQHELARLVRRVVQPLGPALLNVPGVKSDVAFLESFAAQVFAGRGTYGWGGKWLGDAYHVMLYARLQPEIVFDETIVQRGLEGFRVLVMCDCDVITEAMLQRIRAFQAAGGIVVGDDRCCPAIRPDILLQPYQRTGRADQDKAALLALAADLRKRLDARYARRLDSSDPEVIPYLRQGGAGEYVFVVNDRREFGQYVGQHGLVMENGLPSDATLALRTQAAAIYDLVDGRPVPARREGDRLLWDVHLGPCDGGVFLVVPKPIHAVTLDGPELVEPGAKAVCTMKIVDADGKPIEAVIPVQWTIRDAETRVAEHSGYHAAVGGELAVTIDVAANDPPGVWQIVARELASGRTAVREFRVRGPEPWPPLRKPPPKDAANPVQPQACRAVQRTQSGIGRRTRRVGWAGIDPSGDRRTRPRIGRFSTPGSLWGLRRARVGSKVRQARVSCRFEASTVSAAPTATPPTPGDAGRRHLQTNLIEAGWRRPWETRDAYRSRYTIRPFSKS